MDSVHFLKGLPTPFSIPSPTSARKEAKAVRVTLLSLQAHLATYVQPYHQGLAPQSHLKTPCLWRTPLQAGGPQHLGSEEHRRRIMVVMRQARSKETDLVSRAFKTSQSYPWEKGSGIRG